jgi:hypothetical protein
MTVSASAPKSSTGSSEHVLEVTENMIWVAGGGPPLYHAAFFGKPEALKILIANGADVNQPGAYGYTPLMAAARHGDLECVKLLLTAGADPNQLSSAGYTALDLAKNDEADLVVELLSPLTQDPWAGAKLEALSSYDGKFAKALVRILAGISANVCWRGDDYIHGCSFLNISDYKQIQAEEAYDVTLFLKEDIWPVAFADDGCYWAVKRSGDHNSPVYYWDHSGLCAEKAFQSFSSFMKALEF